MVAGCGQGDKKNLSADQILVYCPYPQNLPVVKERDTNQRTRSNKTNVESTTKVKKKKTNERMRSNKTNVESATKVKRDQ